MVYFYRALAFCVLAMLFGCATPSQTESMVASQSTALDRVAAQAELALNDIDSDADWVLAATELARAMQAMARTDAATALLRRAASRAAGLAEPTGKANALSLVAAAMIDIDSASKLEETLANARDAADAIAEDAKRWDMLGKLAATDAQAGGLSPALAVAMGMPQSDDILASYKARTLHDIAPAQAGQFALDSAVDTVRKIDMGLPYYRAAAASDVAIEAHAQGRPDIAAMLLSDAESVGRSQTDGYFIAGSLRHVAVAHASMNDTPAANRFFADALDAALLGESPQHRARAMSRVATSMADVGHFEAAIAAMPKALELARGEDREAFRWFSFYEIAGSAAFAGDFATATQLLQEIPPDFAFGSNSVKAAAQRDVAWGMARHRRLDDALDLALAIDSPRERAQALSRILQLQMNPDMIALPRYL